MRSEKNLGFTLIEVMVASIIIAILAMIAVPAYLNQHEKAMGSKALENLSNLYNAELLYRVDHASFSTLVTDLVHYGTFSTNDGSWTYSIVAAGNNNFTLRATRSAGRFITQSIDMTYSGLGNQKSVDFPGAFTGWPPI